MSLRNNIQIRVCTSGWMTKILFMENNLPKWLGLAFVFLLYYYYFNQILGIIPNSQIASYMPYPYAFGSVQVCFYHERSRMKLLKRFIQLHFTQWLDSLNKKGRWSSSRWKTSVLLRLSLCLLKKITFLLRIRGGVFKRSFMSITSLHSK